MHGGIRPPPSLGRHKIEVVKTQSSLRVLLARLERRLFSCEQLQFCRLPIPFREHQLGLIELAQAIAPLLTKGLRLAYNTAILHFDARSKIKFQP